MYIYKGIKAVIGCLADLASQNGVCAARQENHARFSGAKETSLQDMDQGQLDHYSKLGPKITSTSTYSLPSKSHRFSLMFCSQFRKPKTLNLSVPFGDGLYWFISSYMLNMC